MTTTSSGLVRCMSQAGQMARWSSRWPESWQRLEQSTQNTWLLKSESIKLGRKNLNSPASGNYGEIIECFATFQRVTS